MKFMKLGSRPDTFYTAEAVRSVSSEVSSDLIVQVKGSRYLLHKFPLLSKCLRLQRLCSESPDSQQHQIVQLPDFPGGIEMFELCAKFCYGITITVSAYNIVSARCAAEYLEMTEDVEKGNLIYKLEVFLNSCILQGWKDAIVTLQSTKTFSSWSEELGITSRCIEAIASKVQAHPLKVNLSHSYSRRGRDDVSCNGAESQRHLPLNKGWWAEDLAELGIDLYWRTMIAIKSGGKIPSNLIGHALRTYASRWLPNISKDSNAKERAEPERDSDYVGDATSKHRLLLESIISLLPLERGAVSCSFLLKILKAANILNASSSSKMDLARRIGIQLEEARVSDLLISPFSQGNGTIYDVDIVMTILEQFMVQGQSPPTSPRRTKDGFERRRRSRSAENIDFELQESRRTSSASHSSKLKVAKLVDGYLKEIARDVNLPLSKFIALAEAIPDFARLDHDDLYKAIDIYLKAHPNLTKSERKHLCRILDCKKLSMEACMHAAQNELLPLRVVVQVLFFEQARAAMTGGQVTELPSNIKALLTANGDPRRPTTALSSNTTVPTEDQWSVSGLKSPSTKLSTLRMKLAEDDDLEDNYADGIGKHSKANGVRTLPTRPKRMFSKLWSINRSASEKK
ncbi:BTB/POZ domain-containing protein At1g67900-like [Diospyros lotus]|uniref:BTB/POZ domain-containing protein At1g67900-like n=1 Tax=Diospyros lotus TaxID=55363 RepID=UPI0022581780|nr:BTB/POZ domain-containing protein At1g67900-like [Diospyros lotus]